jgi:hypothetical protein
LDHPSTLIALPLQTLSHFNGSSGRFSQQVPQYQSGRGRMIHVGFIVWLDRFVFTMLPSRPLQDLSTIITTTVGRSTPGTRIVRRCHSGGFGALEQFFLLTHDP